MHTNPSSDRALQLSPSSTDRRGFGANHGSAAPVELSPAGRPFFVVDLRGGVVHDIRTNDPRFVGARFLFLGEAEDCGEAEVVVVPWNGETLPVYTVSEVTETLPLASIDALKAAAEDYLRSSL